MNLKNVRQEDAVRVFIRLGGVERQGKGSHRVVQYGRVTLSFPKGILKEALLKKLLRVSGVTEQEFLARL